MEVENGDSLRLADMEGEASNPTTGPERSDPTVDIEQPVALAEAKGLRRNSRGIRRKASQRFWTIVA